jgi:hypothetical protein
MASGLRSASPYGHGSRTLIGNGTTIGGRSKNTNFLSVANFMLFGSTEPYLSTDKKKEIEQEFKEEMKNLMK